MKSTNYSILNYLKDRGGHIPDSSFTQWHLKLKYEVLDNLLDRYLFDRCSFIDIACGDGDALVLADKYKRGVDLWGVDIDVDSLKRAKSRVEGATLSSGDMLNMEFLPENKFDILHEFGATFFFNDWRPLIQQYFRLTKRNGLILWEIPQRWSTAHIMYLMSIAPKLSDNDTKIERLIRSFSPTKYTYLSDEEVMACIDKSGYKYEIVEKVPIWYFYCMGAFRVFLDYISKITGDGIFYTMDKYNKIVMPQLSGYYLVIRKL
jgi:ubiquinone/menaquinone biosynthesis C-methylase UbiE